MAGCAFRACGELLPEPEGLEVILPVFPESRVVFTLVQLSPTGAWQAQHREDDLDAVSLGFVERLDQQGQVGFVDVLKAVRVANQEVPVFGGPGVGQDANVVQAQVSRRDVPLGTVL